jgi:TolB protein
VGFDGYRKGAVVRWGAAIASTLSVVLIAGGAGAQVRGTIVGPGATSFPIAVSPLKSTSGAERDAGTFADIVARDLDLSGLFRVIDRGAYIENAQTSGVTADTIDFKDWSAIGAQALVKGTVERDGEGLVIEARLFDVVEGKQIGGKRYRAGDDELRRVSHRFADEIMQILTGERGPFESRVAFASRRRGRFKEIYAMSLDAGDLRPITRDGSIALAPSWSPDGRSILFTSFASGNPSLFITDLGGDKRLLSSRRGLNLGGRWSPGGKAIAVALEAGGATDIALLDPDGQIMHFVTKDRSIDVSPSWSPDGQSIVFCSDRGGGPQIYVVGAQGGTPRRVTFEGSYNTSPAWSPKGDRIAYASRIGGRFQIFTVSLGGGDVKRVTSTRGDNEDPSWSPDGRYLVFSSTRDGSGAIYVSYAVGTRQTRLTPSGGDDSSPAWSRWLE